MTVEVEEEEPVPPCLAVAAVVDARARVVIYLAKKAGCIVRQFQTLTGRLLLVRRSSHAKGLTIAIASRRQDCRPSWFGERPRRQVQVRKMYNECGTVFERMIWMAGVETVLGATSVVC